MPNWVSKDGKWFPAKEHVVLPHMSGKVDPKTGKSLEVYDGPDRAALFELFKQKVEHLGMDFRDDVELITRVKQLGYKSVDEYAKVMGYDPEKATKNFEEKASKVNLHELPKKVKEIEILGGGKDFAGQGQDRKGGFGLPKELK